MLNIPKNPLSRIVETVGRELRDVVNPQPQNRGPQGLPGPSGQSLFESPNAITGPVGDRPADRVRPFDPATFDPNNPQDVEALAQEYAPIRYLHPDEAHGPGDPNQFIENSELREHRSLRPDSTPDGFGRGEIDPAELQGQDGDNLYLDLEDSDEARAGTPNAPSFYEYDQESNTITYHHFYNYNDAPGPGNFNHEGDWERVTVQLDDQYKPTEVRYSAHEGNTTLPWDQAPKEDGRPVTYVGLGSHANSPTPGEHPTGVPFVNDQFARGERIDDRERPLQEITSQPWYGIDAHWGQRGDAAAFGQEFTSGPQGPGPDKGPLF